MIWSYSGTPYNGRQRVRAMIGDTNADDQFLTDYEIDAVLAVFTNEIEAAAHLCLNLSARFAIEGDIRVDGYYLESQKKAEFFRELSKELFKQIHGSTRPIPLAGASFGGVSVSNKDSNKANTDNTAPLFYRGQFGYQTDDSAQSDES